MRDFCYALYEEKHFHRASRECLNYLGNPTEARTSYYIKVDAILVQMP